MHDVLVRENKRESLYLTKGRCHRSQRKNEAPHTMQITVKSLNAFLYVLNHWCLLGRNDIPATMMCTSLPQEWHKPRGKKIEPEPVMNCTFVKSTYVKEGKRKSDPVCCKLYDARGKKLKSDGWSQQNIMDMCSFLSNEEKSPYNTIQYFIYRG